MTSPKWVNPPSYDIPAKLREAVPGHPLLLQTLVARGVLTPEQARKFLYPDQYIPASAHDLPDMDKALERIQRALESGERMLVWGDFDVDGQTATALLVTALRELGGVVDFHVPHREREGHGIHIGTLKSYIEQGIQVILTCDTGIAAHYAVDYANEHGVDVVITDHHQLPGTLPNAYAAVNPQRLPAGHPLRTLPGVGCAFKLVEALYAAQGIIGETDAYLDLVALGIVADVAVQIDDTRYLLQRGLQKLRTTKRIGLQQLMVIAGIIPDFVDEETIGFDLGPRLNAAGRLSDAAEGVELLMTDDMERARILAEQLEGLNVQRKELSNQVFEGALKQIENDPSVLNYAALVLAHGRWPGGIVGIVANRLVEKYARPVVLLVSQPGELARGSARSITGCDITAAIAEHAELLNGFGGHTMAAGMSLDPANIPEFRRQLSKSVKAMLKDFDETPTQRIDAYIALADVDESLTEALSLLAPFGPGNPSLVLAAKKVETISMRPLGRMSEHLRLTVADEAGTEKNVFWWRAQKEDIPPGRFDLAFTVHTGVFQGRAETRLDVVNVRPVEEAPRTYSERGSVQVIDLRGEMDKLTVLSDLKDAVIYAEAELNDGVSGYTRLNIPQAETLVIWTTPPGKAEFRSLLERVNPGKVVLIAENPKTDAGQAFLGRMGGVINHTLAQKNGKTSLPELAAAMGHRIQTIEIGLRWFTARGQVQIIEQNGDDLTIAAGGSKQANANDLTTQLMTALGETAAYRGYFQRADAQILVNRPE